MRYARLVFCAPITIYAAVVFLLTGSATGCATTAPARLGLHELLADPISHQNERVELTDHVIDYEPATGDTYRTLKFKLGSTPDETISVFAAGYTADAIAKASGLVGEAFEAREPLTVVGTLRLDPQGEAAAVPELRLESVAYGSRKIAVTQGLKTRRGFDFGDWHITPSIGIEATITP